MQVLVHVVTGFAAAVVLVLLAVTVGEIVGSVEDWIDRS